MFYSDVRDLIQTVVLPDTTTQTQNVGDGRFYGVELRRRRRVWILMSAGTTPPSVAIITDALLPNLRPTGVPTHKAFLYAAWQPIAPLTITPNLDLADDRWSDVINPAPAFPYVQTGAYTLLNLLRPTCRAEPRADFGFKNLLDDNYELAWGFPQPGRTFYVKTRMLF